MKNLLLVVTMLAVTVHAQPTNVSSSDDLEQWELFKVKYKKIYESEEEHNMRRKIFQDNLAFVREHNSKYERGEVTFDVAINRFSDMTTEEVVATMTGLRNSEDWVPSGEVFQIPEDLELPATVDWREKGAVTPVKDQGNCGSCWAFSTTGSLEGLTFIKTKKLVSLSEQDLVDCSTNNSGCGGGLPERAFMDIKNIGGIDTETSYPYEGRNNTCRYNPKNIGATDSGYVEIASGSEAALQAAVATKGPISVGIDAQHDSFQLYTTGVYHEPNCSSIVLSHAVLLVGYGTDATGGDYWLVKNSWSTQWGDQGYIKMARNRNNMCGIASLARYPIV